MNLFPFQAAGIEAIRAAIREGHRSIVVQSPTGSGKTVVAGHVLRAALARGARTLFVAHRMELLEQPLALLLASGVPDADIGLRAGYDRSRRRPEARVQIAGIDSLKEGDFAGYRVIVIDEAHRACCRTYLRALASRDPDSIVLGLTATPERLDGKGLREAGFTKIVVLAQPTELIALGRIVDPSIYTVPDSLLPDLSEVGVERGDFAQVALATAMRRVDLVGSLVEHYRRRGQGLPAVAFAVSVEHSQEIVAMFNAAGITARHVDASSGAKARKQALLDLRDGRLRVASQCNLWVEGMDQPAIRVAIHARPTASLTIWLQSCGRVMRPYEGQPAIVLDHAGNALRHGLPSEDRVYALDGRSKGAPRPPSIRRCPSCYLVVSQAARVCPVCAYDFPPGAEPAVTYTPQQLRLLDPPGYRRSVWERLWAESYADGQKSGWVYAKYRERFGKSAELWPVPPKPPIDDSPLARAAKARDLSIIARRQSLPRSWVEEKMKRIFGDSTRAA